MLKIGILGSDNSHALHFSQAVNIEKDGQYLFPDARVTHIYGHDVQITKDVAEEGKIDNIVSDYKDMIGKVDAVMVVFRDGKYHYQYALPLLVISIWVRR